MKPRVDDLSIGVGKVGEANTGDDLGRGVGEETIPLCQVPVCGDDHGRSGGVHVPTVGSC